MFFDNKKGKIIIDVEKIEDRLNSKMEFHGIAKNSETAITTLLVNFISLSLEKGKDPKQLIDKHFQGILDMLKSGKKIDKTK